MSEESKTARPGWQDGAWALLAALVLTGGALAYEVGAADVLGFPPGVIALTAQSLFFVLKSWLFHVIVLSAALLLFASSRSSSAWARRSPPSRLGSIAPTLLAVLLVVAMIGRVHDARVPLALIALLAGLTAAFSAWALLSGAVEPAGARSLGRGLAIVGVSLTLLLFYESGRRDAAPWLESMRKSHLPHVLRIYGERAVVRCPGSDDQVLIVRTESLPALRASGLDERFTVETATTADSDPLSAKLHLSIPPFFAACGEPQASEPY